MDGSTNDDSPRRFGDFSPDEAVEAMRRRQAERASKKEDATQPVEAAERDTTPPKFDADRALKEIRRRKAEQAEIPPQVPARPVPAKFNSRPYVIAGWIGLAVVVAILTAGGGSDQRDEPDVELPGGGGSGKATCQERLDSAINIQGISEEDRVAIIKLIHKECGAG